MEHIVPRIRKGTSDLDNLALSCSGCNGLKYTSVAGRDDITGEIVSLYHPRKHVWSEHFQWSEDGLKIVGQTPIGRTTVLRLELNRAGVVSIREALLLSGRHPMREDE
jgi:hypothetical protein